MNTQIDPRGPRFNATLTAIVLAVVLFLAPSQLATGLLAAQAVLFGVGAWWGIQHTPAAWLFRTAIRPRLAPPAELEDAAPPRFAQGVGFGFAVVAVAGFVVGAPTLGLIAAGLALAAALLNAVFGFCLGCEIYLIGRRLLGSPETAKVASTVN
jgi:Domain of unknown function (DUF4395)